MTYSQRTSGRWTLKRYISSSPWQALEKKLRCIFSSSSPTYSWVDDPRLLGSAHEQGVEDWLILSCVFHWIPATISWNARNMPEMLICVILVAILVVGILLSNSCSYFVMRTSKQCCPAENSLPWTHKKKPARKEALIISFIFLSLIISVIILRVIMMTCTLRKKTPSISTMVGVIAARSPWSSLSM